MRSALPKLADCYATLRDFMEKFNQKNWKFFREFFFSNFFLAIGVPQPIWGMPAKIWGV
jgi:hypothetical protein